MFRSVLSKLMARYPSLGDRNHMMGLAGLILGIVGAIPVVQMYLPSQRNAVQVLGEAELEDFERQLREEPAHIDSRHPTWLKVIDSEWQEPNNLGFELLEEAAVWDLREVAPRIDAVIRNRNELVSPATLRSRIRLRKKIPADTYTIPYETTGTAVFARCDYPLDSCKVSEKQSTIQWGGQPMTAYQIKVDVAAIPVGGEFLVNVRRTYWNAFELEDQTWAGIHIRQDMQHPRLSLMVIEPLARPFKSYKFLLVNRISGEGEELDPNALTTYEDPTNRFVYWRIANPLQDKIYRIDWD